MDGWCDLGVAACRASVDRPGEGGWTVVALWQTRLVPEVGPNRVVRKQMSRRQPER